MASVHSLRNLQNMRNLRILFAEAFRVLKPGGRILVAESSLDDTDCITYWEFYKLRQEVDWEMELPYPSAVMNWLREAGFKQAAEQVLETELEYAPVYFPVESLPLKKLKVRYRNAVERLKAEGRERHPAVSLITAFR